VEFSYLQFTFQEVKNYIWEGRGGRMSKIEARRQIMDQTRHVDNKTPPIGRRGYS